jgi:hypothetical protein
MPKFEPSEWGKMSKGQRYQVLALDIFRAFAAAGLNDYEWLIMQVVIEQSWYNSVRRKRGPDDWPEPVACKLNVSEFARDLADPGEDAKATKARRNRLFEAKRSLIASGMLTEDADGLWPIKDADRWTRPDGSPRLAPGRVAYAASARSRKGSEVHGIPGTEYTENRVAPTRNSGYPLHGKTGSATRNSGYSHIEEPARGDPTELDPKKREEDVLIRADANNTHTQAPDPSPHLMPDEDRLLIAEASALAEAWFPQRDLGIAISRDEQRFNSKSPDHWPASWLKPALERLRDQPASKATWPYLRSILRGFVETGGPPPPTANGAAPRPSKSLARQNAVADAFRARQAETDRRLAEEANHEG